MTNLYKALADFQQECPIIHKDTKGYSYTYANPPTILEKINPLLKKHGLGFTQLLQENQLETVIFHHKSGEVLKSVVNLPQGVELKGMNDFQVMGSAITYFRRYALSCALGIVTDKDSDSGGLASSGTSEAKKDIILQLGNCENKIELGVLWDSLEEKEQSEYKELFSKRKANLK